MKPFQVELGILTRNEEKAFKASAESDKAMILLLKSEEYLAPAFD